MSIRIFSTALLCLLFGSIIAQDACSRVDLNEWTKTLKNEGIIIGESESIEKKRESICRLKSENSNLVIKLSLTENEVFDRFPSLFKTTIQKYISNGEDVSKLKTNRPKRKFAQLEGIDGFGAIHKSDDLIKCYWISSGQALFTLELTNGNLSKSTGHKLMSELIKHVK